MAITPLTATAEAHDNIGKKHDELVVLLQSTLAIGDYEELFFKFLEAMRSQTHWAIYESYLLMAHNTYDSLIEEIYG
jgi:hypothetical protein